MMNANTKNHFKDIYTSLILLDNLYDQVVEYEQNYLKEVESKYSELKTRYRRNNIRYISAVILLFSVSFLLMRWNVRAWWAYLLFSAMPAALIVFINPLYRCIALRRHSMAAEEKYSIASAEYRKLLLALKEAVILNQELAGLLPDDCKDPLAIYILGHRYNEGKDPDIKSVTEYYHQRLKQIQGADTQDAKQLASKMETIHKRLELRYALILKKIEELDNGEKQSDR